MSVNVGLLASGRLIRVILAIATLALSLVANTYALPTGFQMETLVAGLTQPVYLAQLPDGRMLVGTKGGSIRIFDPNDPAPATATYLEINNINSERERGLTSIAIDPDFQSNGFVYVYYTHGTNRRNRISRFSHIDSYADPATELLIWEDNEEFQDCCHYGGGIGFGPDGKLYLTTGEEFDGPQAQDLTRAGGKIIRINPDGSIPPDNPFADGPGGNLDEIWAYGLRNPYRAYWDLVAGRLYVGEVGGNLQESSREDIHVGRIGANYGWPYCEGQCLDPQYDDPIYDYGHAFPGGEGGAVTLGSVYRGSQFPTQYLGALFFTDYVQGWVRYLELNGDGSLSSVNDFAANVGPVVHLTIGHDGALYLVDISGSIKRITYTSGNQPPVIESISHDGFPGPAPALVDFDVVATDPEGDPLTYVWLPGDGSEVSGRAITHEYQVTGVYQARVQVSDGNRTTLSDPVTVQVGSPPAATIVEPLDGALFRAGDLIAFSGWATDPDGSLADSNFTWTVRFGHNTHTHPAATHVGAAGTLEVNTSGHDYHDDTRYEFELTVTDADGLTATARRTIFPDKANLELSTSPIATTIFLDGLPLQTPISYDTLIGFKHLLSVAGQQCVDGTQYRFDSWSNGGSLSHEVVVPEAGMALTANFVAEGPCNEVLAEGLVLHLEADSGVAHATGTATSWLDLSGQGNDLSGFGDPQWIAGALNGYPVVAFDGAGDKFERTGSISGLPANNEDRTVVILASYESKGYGGFIYGTGACSQAFGLGVKPKGQLMVEGWCSNYPSITAGTGAGWLVHSAILSNGELTQYKDGELIYTKLLSFSTVLTNMVLGANLDSGNYVAIKVAAVLAYDRALSSAELAQVHDYLNQKYLSGGSQPPVATDDVAVVREGESVSIDVLANDAASAGALDPASVVIVEQPVEGAVSVEPLSGTVTYTHAGGAGPDVFSYQVSDTQGQVSNSARVEISVEDGGANQAPTATDDTGSVTSGGDVEIDVLANDIDPEAQLDAGSVTIVSPPSAGEVMVDGTSGVITYSHDGGSTITDSFGYRVSDLSGLASGTATVSVTITEPAAAVSLSSPMEGALVQGPSLTLTYVLSGSGYDSLRLTFDGELPLVDGALTGSYLFTDVSPGERYLTADLLDNSGDPIPGASDSLRVLVSDGIGSPLALDDTATLFRGDTTDLVVLANDVDVDGNLDPASTFISTMPQYGSVTVDSGTGVIRYRHDGSEATSDSFSYRVLDNDGLTSNEATVALTISEAIPGSGMVLHLEADRGVMLDGNGGVALWQDQSGQGNDLSAAGGPKHMGGVLNGQPIVAFDGVDDKFERTDTLNGFPSGNTDRSVYLVVSYNSGGYGGFGFGAPACNQMFGTSVNPTGNLMVQGWCRSTDFHSVEPGTGAGWLVQTAVLQSGQLIHYRDGEPIASHSNDFDTLLSGLVLGAEIDSNPYLDMQVAAVLVYNRALSSTEQAAVQEYLRQKYFSGSGGNQAPVAVDDSGSLTSGNTLSLSVLQNDSDPDGSLDPATVTILQEATNGSLEVDPSTGAISYSHHGSGTADSFTYRVADNLGSFSNAASVSISVTDEPVNQPPAAGDDNTAVSWGGVVLIPVLDNDSDPEAKLDPASVTISTQPLFGSVAAEAVTGEIHYQHGGTSLEPDSFTYQVSDLDGLTSGAAAVSVEILAPDATISLISPESGAFVQGSTVALEYTVSGTGYDHLDLRLDDMEHHSVTEPTGSHTFLDVLPGEHSITVALVDSEHGPLPVSSASASVLFTVFDEIGSPFAMGDQAGVGRGQSTRLNVLANDLDVDGILNPASVFISEPPLEGTALVDGATGTVEYIHSGGAASSDSFRYQVQDDSGLLSNEAMVSLSITDAVPLSGLVLHLEADSGVSTVDGTTVTGWADQSGQGNDLTGAGYPQLLTGALGGQAVIDFDGASDKLERTAVLSGFPAGNTDRTVFVLVNYRGTGYGGFGFGKNSCNQMFGTSVNPTGDLMVQGWCRDSDFHTFVAGTGTGWMVHWAVLQESQLGHFRDTELIDSRTNSFNTTLTRLVLGAELDGKPYVDMQVGAVLVYNRALSAAEQAEVLDYLQHKYQLEQN